MWRRLAGAPSGRSRFCSPMLAPPTDVYETRDRVVIVAEIAGIEEQEVEIEIEGDHLAFHGEKVDHRRRSPATATLRWRYATASSGARVLLPAKVDPEGAQVSYSDGFLRIVLPKLEQAPKRVRVNVAQAET